MISPKFPFKNDQIILSSDRIMLHSKNDCIFLFGKGAVSLSSPNTVNVDANEKVVVFSPRIELGNEPASFEPTMKGRTFLIQLSKLCEVLEEAGRLLNGSSESDIAGSMFNIAAAGQKIEEQAKRLKNLCEVFDEENTVLSKSTFVS